MDRQPVFSFGVISDIQYADHDDCQTRHAASRRYFRNSLVQTARAFQEFEQLSASHVLQLGDIIDGKSRSEAEKALNEVLNVFNNSTIPVHHSIGNHELYNFKRTEILDKLFNGEKGYYSFEQDNIRFVCLDTFEVSLLGIDKSGEEYKRIEEYLRSKNPSEDLNDPDQLEGDQRRFVKFNGALSDTQVSWLKEQLHEAVLAKQKVVVYGHASIHPELSIFKNLIWNYSEVLDILEECPAVVLVLSGHTHLYSSCSSNPGKLYVCLPAVIETPPDGRGWATVQVYSDGLEVIVHDSVDSHRLRVHF